MAVTENLRLENVRIGFRNFAGEAGKYNAAGNRNFVVFLDTEIATQLELDGWNIRWLEPRNEEEDRQGYMQVTVAFNNYPPTVMLISMNQKTILDEETINILDWADIASVDLVIRPYNWEVNGKTGVKAYVKNMYVKLREDEFAKKYQNIPVADEHPFRDED